MFTTRGLSTERGRLKMGKWNSPNLSETQGFECLGNSNWTICSLLSLNLFKMLLCNLICRETDIRRSAIAPMSVISLMPQNWRNFALFSRNLLFPNHSQSRNNFLRQRWLSCSVGWYPKKEDLESIWNIFYIVKNRFYFTITWPKISKKNRCAIPRNKIAQLYSVCD